MTGRVYHQLPRIYIYRLQQGLWLSKKSVISQTYNIQTFIASKNVHFCPLWTCHRVMFLWTCHYGHVTMDMSLWMCHYGHVTINVSLWTCHYGRVSMDMSQSYATMDVSLWTCHYGHDGEEMLSPGSGCMLSSIYTEYTMNPCFPFRRLSDIS